MTKAGTRIDQHNPCDLVRIVGGVELGDTPAVGVANHQKGAVFAGIRKQSVQLAGVRERVTWARGGVTPAEASPVIGTDTRVGGEPRLHELPLGAMGAANVAKY